MKNNTLYLTRGALIAALYVALTYISALFGLSSGAIQFRISEMLCILPVFMPEAIIGVTVGCLISNIICGGVFFDILFGTLATLIGALLCRLFIYLPKKLRFLASIPTVISNSVIVPFVLRYAYGAEGSFLFVFAGGFVGEAVCAGIGGALLYKALNKSKFLKNQI